MVGRDDGISVEGSGMDEPDLRFKRHKFIHSLVDYYFSRIQPPRAPGEWVDISS
jgi:hypothetical protein